MQKLLLFLIFSGILAIGLKAQQDTVPMGKIVYLHQTSLSSEQQNNGTATLYFNTRYSVYVHDSAPKHATSVTDPTGYTRNFKGDREGYPIYKMHQQRRILYKTTSPMVRGGCVVEDTLGGIAWAIHGDRKRFGSYVCWRATGVFRGREYEAWFAPDIPVSSGPHKLGGLPGLILEARSLDGLVSFLFKSLEISPEVTGVIKPPSGKYMNMNYGTFKKAVADFCKEQEKDYRARGMEVTISPVTDTIEQGDE